MMMTIITMADIILQTMYQEGTVLSTLYNFIFLLNSLI